MSLETCRMCLSGHTKMFNLADTHLEELYERMTLIPLNDMDRMPLVACYVCHHLLKRIKRFIDKSVQADDFLRQALYLQSGNRSKSQRTFDVTSLQTNLHVSPTRCLSYNPHDVAENTTSGAHNCCDNLKMNNEDVVLAEYPLQNKYIERLPVSSKSVDVEIATTSHAATSTEREAGNTVRQRKDTKTDDIQKPQTAPKDPQKSIPAKTFNCIHCVKVFNTKLKLIFHLRTHKRSKRQRCNFCPKRFVHESDLIRHVRTHTKEKPYPCTHCNKSFRLKGTLTRHMLTHSDVKPFSCSFCGKEFTTKFSLTNHISIHTGEKPFLCNQCGASYAQKRSFVRHVEKHKVKIEVTV